MARTPAQRRPARSGAARRASRPEESAQKATASEYRVLESIAAAATESAIAVPGTNAYRASAAAHRVAARAAEDAGLSRNAEGHDVVAQEHDEAAERLAAAWRADLTKHEPDLERDVKRLLGEGSRRGVRSRR